jgi:hypothetical protein
MQDFAISQLGCCGRAVPIERSVGAERAVLGGSYVRDVLRVLGALRETPSTPTLGGRT